MRNFAGVLLLAVACAAAGCSSEPEPVETDPSTGMAPLDSKAELKSFVEGVAANPSPIGSGIGRIRSGIEQIRSSDAALADELSKQADELERATKPDQIKSIAEAMAAKL